MDIYILNSSKQTIKIVDQFSSLIWHEKFFTAGAFELHLSEVIEGAVYVYINASKELGIIEKVEIKKDEIVYSGRMILSLLGRGVSHWLNPPTYTALKTENIAREIVSKIMGDDIQLETLTRGYYGSEKTLQLGAGENCLDYVTALLKSDLLGCNVEYDFVTGVETFKVKEVIDHTNDMPPLSYDYDNIVDYNYSEDMTNYKNSAYIEGTYEGVKMLAEIASATEEKRYAYVDGSSLKSTYTNEGGASVTMSQADFTLSLINLGLIKLADFPLARAVNITPVVNSDLLLGTKRLFQDKKNGIESTQIITEVATAYESNGVRRDITFGEPKITLSDKIKRGE